VIGGALPYETGLNLVVTRARLLQSDPTNPGGMAVVGASQERVLLIIHELGLDDQLVIAAYNGPESHVISGEIKAIDTFLSIASIRGFRAAKVKVDQGALSINVNFFLCLNCAQPFTVHASPLVFLPFKSGLMSIGLSLLR
jgi:acyl transferase domain-containing protein